MGNGNHENIIRLKNRKITFNKTRKLFIEKYKTVDLQHKLLYGCEIRTLRMIMKKYTIVFFL